MNEPVFCPNCLLNDTLSKIVVRKRLLHRDDQYCKTCKTSFELNATLISEDTVRYMVKQRGSKCEHLLVELENLR